MKRILFTVPLAVTLSGCPEKKAAPTVTTTASAAGSTGAPATSGMVAVMASASSTAEPSLPPSVIEVKGKVACVPPKLIAEGAVSVYPGGKDGVAFCFVGEGMKPKACYGLDFESGDYAELATFQQPPLNRRSSGGTHLLELASDGLGVCDLGRKDCKTFPAKGMKPGHDPSKILADVSPDGKRLVTVTQAGGIELFDVASKKSEKKSSIRIDSFVDSVAWLGKRIMVIGCVDAGPGCTAQLWDPESAKATRVEINTYASGNPAHPAGGPLWAFVDSNGGEIAFNDVDTGLPKGKMAVGLAADVEKGVSTDRKKAGEIAIVSGGPHGGSIARVDLVGKRVMKKYAPPACKK